MQIVRTIIWVLALVAVLAFSAANWTQEVAVAVWPDLIWETKLPAVVIVAFLLGLLPLWLVNLGTKWRLQRRIKTLEGSVAAATAPPPAPPPPPVRTPAPEPAADPALTPSRDKTIG